MGKLRHGARDQAGSSKDPPIPDPLPGAQGGERAPGQAQGQRCPPQRGSGTRRAARPPHSALPAGRCGSCRAGGNGLAPGGGGPGPSPCPYPGPGPGPGGPAAPSRSSAGSRRHRGRAMGTLQDSVRPGSGGFARPPPTPKWGLRGWGRRVGKNLGESRGSLGSGMGLGGRGWGASRVFAVPLWGLVRLGEAGGGVGVPGSALPQAARCPAGGRQRAHRGADTGVVVPGWSRGAPSGPPSSAVPQILPRTQVLGAGCALGEEDGNTRPDLGQLRGFCSNPEPSAPFPSVQGRVS